MRASSLLVVTLLLVAAPACGVSEPMSANPPLTARERTATKLVAAETGSDVSCRDNGAVNSRLAPDHPIGYSCFDDSGEFYNAVVSPDGALMSVSGPICFLNGGSRDVVESLGFENIPDCK